MRKLQVKPPQTAFFAAGRFHSGERAYRRGQSTQPQGLPLRVWQAAKLLPGEDALQPPAPKIKRPVDEIGEKVQAMLRHHDCAALPLQSGDLVVEPGNGSRSRLAVGSSST